VTKKKRDNALEKRLKQYDAKIIDSKKGKKGSHNSLKNKAKKRNVERTWRGWRESDGKASPVITYNKKDL